MASWLMRGASKSTIVAAKEVTAAPKEGNDQQFQSKKLEEIRYSEDEAASTTDESVAKDPEAKIFIVSKQGNEYLIYDKKHTIEVVKQLPDKHHKAFESGRENSLIGTKNPTTLDDLIAEAKKPESTKSPRQLVEGKLRKKLHTPEFHGKGKRVIYRLEWADALLSSHYYRSELKKYCPDLGITNLDELEARARDVQDDHPPVAQAHSAAIISEDTPKTTGNIYFTEAELFHKRANIIKETGKVVIASEKVKGVDYYLVQCTDDVPIIEKTNDTESYKKCIAADGEDDKEEGFAPLSHIRKLEKYAEKGLDSFKESVKGARLAKNDHPTLDFEIWLFRIQDSLIELRCYSNDVGEQLLDMLGLSDIVQLTTALNPAKDSQPAIPDPPSSSDVSFPQQRTDPAERFETLESTEAVPARTGDFYKPGDGSGRHHYFATHVGDGSKIKDATPCIVQNVDKEDSYRIWSWKQVKDLGAEDHTVTYKFNKRQKKAYPSSRRQFHLPDKEGIGRLKGWGLEPTDFSVITTLTWRVEARKRRRRERKTAGNRDGYEYYNSVLFTIPDTTNPDATKKKQLLLNYRKQQDYNYEGPFRCSISKLRELAGNQVADQKAIEGLQLDTEAGEGYSRYWQRRQEDLKNRKKSRVRSKKWFPNAT
jgi:hypothetical protein